MSLNSQIRVTMRGTMVSSQSWSTGFSLAANAGAVITDADLDTLLTAVEPLVSTWWGATVGTDNTPDVKLTSIGASFIPAGTTKAAAVAEATFPAKLGTGNQASNLPTFIAMVVSLRTSRPGRSGRGRMYVPITALGFTAHQFGGGDCAAVATHTADLLRGVNAISPEIYTVAVCGKAGNFPVVEVSVDTLPDVQHRREDKLGATIKEIAVL